VEIDGKIIAQPKSGKRKTPGFSAFSGVRG